MAQPTKAANDAARAKLIGPFYNPTKAAAAEKALKEATEQQANIQRLIQAAASDPLDYLGDPLRVGAPSWQAHTVTAAGPRVGATVNSMLENLEVTPTSALHKELTRLKHQQVIAEAANAWYRGDGFKVMPAVEGPFRSPTTPAPAGASPKSSVLGPISLLLDLMTRTTDLNSNEDAELAKQRGPAYSNKAEYERLLQQVLQQNSPLGLP